MSGVEQTSRRFLLLVPIICVSHSLDLTNWSMNSPSGTVLAEEWKRHDVWFVDGNVLLSAVSMPGTERGRWKYDANTERDGAKRVKYFFRVHKGVLSRQSDVFRGMFDCPATRGDVLGSSGAQELDGDDKDFVNLPHVMLHDSAEEVSIFIKTVYEPWSVVLFLYWNSCNG